MACNFITPTFVSSKIILTASAIESANVVSHVHKIQPVYEVSAHVTFQNFP